MKNALKILLLVAIILPGIDIKAKDFGLDQPYNKLSGELVTPHIPFCKPYYKNRIKALVIAPTWTQRETVELAQRVSVDYIPLMTESFYSFGPYEGDPSYMGIDPGDFKEEVDNRLSKNRDYEVIIIGKIPWKVFPEAVQKAIIEKVKKGTGLGYIYPVKSNPKLQQKIKWNNQFHLRGVPLKKFGKLKDIPEEELIKSGKLGKGRVAFIDYQEGEQSKRSEEHTSELQSHSFISYAVFCLKKKKKNTYIINNI